MADDLLDTREPGSAFDHILASASEGTAPEDLSERPDHYLYGGGYEGWRSRTGDPDGEDPPRRGSVG